MTGQGQGLLKRHVKYTREEFSEHWLNHASKVTPWALENGVIYHAQVVLINFYRTCPFLDASLVVSVAPIICSYRRLRGCRCYHIRHL